MIKNYFKLALRNIGRKKLYTVINITGLGVASAFCILVYWYVQNERSFDKFHANGDQLYRVEVSDVFGGNNEETKKDFFSFLNKNSGQRNMIQTPVILAAELHKNFPEIEHALRIAPGYEIVVRVNNQSFKEVNNSAYVDAEFFKVLSFPLKEGNPSSVLMERNQVVLSESAALKYFGKTQALGKTLSLSGASDHLYTVSGIAKDFPVNSSFKFDLLINRESVPDYADAVNKGLNSFSDLLILQLKKGTDVATFEQRLDAFGKNYFQPVLKEWAKLPGSILKPENFHLSLRSYADAHYNRSGGWGHYTDLKNIYQLSSLAIVILLIACLNYILLTLTGTVSRSQEVGIRKTIGAARKQIILQFYVETQLLAFISVIAGLLLAVIGLPLFGDLIGTSLKVEYFSFENVMILLLILALLLGVLAGIYPALVMSGLKPLNMLRKFSVYRLNPSLSKALAITQFSVCIILIISTLVISSQMRFMNEQKLGFDKDQVISIQNPFGFGRDPKNIFQLRDRLSHYISTEPAIENITSTWFPYKGYNSNNHVINGEKTLVEDFNIDYNYFSFFKIPIIKGRSFSPIVPEDSAAIRLTDAQQVTGSSAARQAVVVNETLYNLLGHPALNELNRELGARIVGVCGDYHADDLTKKIAPAYHRIQKGYIGYFWIKIKAGQNIAQVINKLQTKWKQLTNGEPFTYTFLHEDVAKSYDAYQRWMQTVTASSLIAIIIACMGLFGLSGLTTVNRIKEIGIRKVLGAKVYDLFLMLNKNTIIMALISFAIAVPVAFYFVNEWLQNFAYRIHLNWTVFALAGMISVITAMVAVSYHTINAAIANPVKSLRTE